MTKITNFFYAFTEAVWVWSGKIFSFILPIVAFTLAIGLAWRIPSLPTWSARTLFFVLVLSLVGMGIYLFIKRKKLWD